MITISKKQIKEKIGKKYWFSDQDLLVAKLDYLNGIELFDEILNGKSLQDIGCVIHIEKYPAGFLLKIAKGFGGIKTYSYPLVSEDILKIRIEKRNGYQEKLTIDLKNSNKIDFHVKDKNYSEVMDFFENFEMTHEFEKGEKRNSKTKDEHVISGVKITTDFFPLAWFLFFVTPIIEINGEKSKRTWGTCFFNLAPGNYTVKIYFSYFGMPQCGANETKIVIEKDEVIEVSYFMPPWMFSKGKIKIIS